MQMVPRLGEAFGKPGDSSRMHYDIGRGRFLIQFGIQPVAFHAQFFGGGV